ncbi:GTP cyclohydrolase IIa [Candidatus Nitrosocosmicus hydrocola]|uniref:GTP cyclohydrolase IIa n=1 Tax=Candidatus Nitrosocosmicus hydrocola TaxID=1826872 RepID=UPI0011E5F989|nr:GTP cyclohydrolase IIa [Candidatus Nitrosocosmicus hydrocola]
MVCQITVIKLEGYGPWTLKLGSDREYRLQMLQALIYADLQEYFSAKNGLVFSNRFDEFVAVTNQITLQDHKEILDKISKKNKKIKLSMTIGIGKTPLDSDKKIRKIRKEKNNSSIDSIFAIEKEHGLQGNSYQKNRNSRIGQISNQNDKDIKDLKIIHIDVDSSTSMTKNLSTYEITNLLLKLQLQISDLFLKEDSLTFFLGGDNFMVVANNDLNISKITTIINGIMKSFSIKLNCGIGNGNNARTAAKFATKSLDQIREYRKNGKTLNVFESS